jgi:hypothetical protein
MNGVLGAGRTGDFVNERHSVDREAHHGLGEHGIERVGQEDANQIECVVSVVHI